MVWFSQGIWVSPVAQTVKNPPEIQETCDPSLDWEDPLEEDILAWRILMDRGAWHATGTGVTVLDMTEQLCSGYMINCETAELYDSFGASQVA